jgi:hypothetical protein
MVARKDIDIKISLPLTVDIKKEPGFWGQALKSTTQG